MPRGDKTLDAILKHERPSDEHVRLLVRELFFAMEHLHHNELIHGDLKLMNVVRSTTDHKLRLIDLDAAVSLDERHRGVAFSGSKLSTGE